MEAIQIAASEALVNVLLAVIALLGAYALYFLRIGISRAKAQIAQIEDARARQAFDDALSDTDYLTEVVVGAFEQTTAGALRELVKDGKVDRQELIDVGRAAASKIRDAVTPEAQSIISKNLGSFNSLVSSLIEQKVGALKGQKTLSLVVSSPEQGGTEEESPAADSPSPV